MIDLVIPVYNEEELIGQLNAELHRVMEQTGETWRVTYVNDGSADRTLDMLRKLQTESPATVRIVDLSRNWGHQAAISAGLSLAGGDAVILMDADFQDPPALLPELVAAWRNGAEVVVARRRSRAETGLRGFLLRRFYGVMRYLSDYPIPLHAGVFGLLDRKAAQALQGLEETNRFLPGLRSWVGFRTEFVEFDRPERLAGEPKQTFGRLFQYAVNAILSFSYKPLRVTLALGFAAAILAFVGALVIVAMRVFSIGIFKDSVVLGYTSMISALLFLGGVQLISIGILGEYIGRVYDEVKRRPLFVIREVIGK
jgi:dolichol-phosphate mannosyltransferase